MFHRRSRTSFQKKRSDKSFDLFSFRGNLMESKRTAFDRLCLLASWEMASQRLRSPSRSRENFNWRNCSGFSFWNGRSNTEKAKQRERTVWGERWTVQTCSVARENEHYKENFLSWRETNWCSSSSSSLLLVKSDSNPFPTVSFPCKNQVEV